MIIFMSGYPFAGKSYTASKLLEALPYAANLINPKTFREPGYEALSEDEKRDQNISVWEVSLDILQDQIKSSADNNIIIYDTACANRDRMVPLFQLAKQQGHHVILVFVQADLEQCAERAKESWLAPEVIEKYIKSFSVVLPLFHSLVDRVFVINNVEEPDVSPVVEHIKGYYA